jgi:uncharacterized metal-binding protein
MQTGILACKPAGSHPVKPAGVRAGQKVCQQSHIIKKKQKYFSKRKQKKEKKKKKAI